MEKLQRIPPVARASNIDGDRMLIIDPLHADLSGWSAEFREDSGQARVERFTLEPCWGDTTSPNLLGYGDCRDFWMAFQGHDAQLTALLGPEGERIPV